MKSKEEILRKFWDLDEDDDIQPYMTLRPDVNRILSAMEAYASQDMWVRVEDRLPEKETWSVHVSNNVMAYDGLWHFEAYYHFEANVWRRVSPNGMERARNVTHWQPLPVPPKPKS